MPYSSMKFVPASLKGAGLNLTQANYYMQIYDTIKKQGKVDNPASVAWNTFKFKYKKQGDKWVEIPTKEIFNNFYKEANMNEADKLNIGGTDTCVCSKCGFKITHKRGTPCSDLICPKCNVSLVGKGMPKTGQGAKENLLQKGDVMPKKLQETTDRIFERVTIDRENSVIHNVKLLGAVSKNGYPYQEKGMQEAVPFYEKVKIFTNHSRDHRTVRDLAGVAVGVSCEDGALHAQDFEVAEGDMKEKIFWIAEHSPDGVGFSHDVEAEFSVDRQGKVESVHKITKVNSVDLVIEPATTKNLFEQFNEKKGGDVSLEAISLKEFEKARPDLVKQIKEGVKMTEEIDKMKNDLEDRDKTIKEQAGRLKEQEVKEQKKVAHDKAVKSITEAMKKGDLDPAEHSGKILEAVTKEVEAETDEEKKAKIIREYLKELQKLKAGEPISEVKDPLKNAGAETKMTEEEKGQMLETTGGRTSR